MDATTIETDRDGYKYAMVTVPGLGVARVGAGTTSYRLKWTDEAPVTVNNVDYHGEVLILLNQHHVEVYLRRTGGLQGAEATASAKTKIVAAVDAWLPTFRDTDVAIELLTDTVTKHNGFSRNIIIREIGKAKLHLQEQERLLARLNEAGPTESVHWSETTYELKERSR